MQKCMEVCRMASVCNLQPSVWLSCSYLSLISLMHAVRFSHLTFLHGFRGVCFCCFCRYGDMRVMMAYELFSMWQNLGECLDSLSVFPLGFVLFSCISKHTHRHKHSLPSEKQHWTLEVEEGTALQKWSQTTIGCCINNRLQLFLLY